MAKTGKKGGGKKKNKREDSSDDDLYKDDVDFDPKNPFGDDDLEQYHAKKDKDLMSAMKKSKNGRFSSDEEEVLAFDDDSDDDSDEDGEFNIEDEDDEDEDGAGEGGDDEDMPNAAWGTKKSSYYSGNKIQNEEDAELEEEEARLLQSKMMKQLDTSDFGLEAFSLTTKSDKEKLILKTSEEIEAGKLAARAFKDGKGGDDTTALQKVAKNLKDLSKKEKLELLKQESPELMELVRDFKEKIEELESTLLPLYGSIKSGQVQSSKATEFILQKTKLYLTYCSYLNFYFILKSERTPVDNHPIIKSILQYRNLCKQLSPIDQKLKGEVQLIKQAMESNKTLTFSKNKPVKSAKKSVRFNRDKNGASAGMSDSDSDEEMNQGDAIVDEKSMKRPINYEIEKNKGLTPKRPKEYRNPRVRNRLKARKANIKHKSIVPKVRPQDKRYAGEGTGIRMNVVRSHKIK